LDTPFEPVHLSSDIAYRRPENRSWSVRPPKGIHD
jgi:hypothetical protein